MKTKLIPFLLLGAAVIACDESKDGLNPNALKPEAGRARLEQIGQEAVALMNPSKQQELLDVIDEFYFLMSNYEVESAASRTADAILQPLKAIANNQLKAVEQYASSSRYETVIVDLSDAYGRWVFNGNIWTYTNANNKLEFRFPVDGESVVISVTMSSETYTNSFESTYTDYDGYDEVEVQQTTTVKIPASITAKITKGTETLTELTIEGKYKLGEPLGTNVDLKMGAYTINFDVDVDRTEISQTAKFVVNGKTLLNSSFVAKGTFSLNPDYYTDGPESEYITDFIKVKSINIKEQILDFSISLGCNDIGAFEREYYELIDEGEAKNYNFKGNGIPYSYSEAYVKKCCSFINEKFSNKASIDGEEFAKVTLIPQYYDYTWTFWGYKDDTRYEINGRYEPLPVLEFFNDGARFAFDEFFTEEGFEDLIMDMEDLIYLYKNCLPSIR